VSKELELWHFIAERLRRGEPVMLLIVVDSSGSSPGRPGYKMAVSASGELCGSIGGGMMEVNLVEQAREVLSEPGAVATEFRNHTIEQVHQKNSPHASGMICSGRQKVVRARLEAGDLGAVESIIDGLRMSDGRVFTVTTDGVGVEPPEGGTQNGEILYRDNLGHADMLYIIGGGHCALALSELMSRLGFAISIFDDRPDLNTIEKNEFADEITIIDEYENIGGMIVPDENAYVVVMTIGYASDAVVMRKLIDHEFKYFGVLGSEAKMATLLRELKGEGIDADKIARIKTPIGLPIKSRTPDEIAVSIAAEIIAVRNA
jgi:xanthine dehydrogenase accessory factor